ncbi:MAG: peptidoglycan-binding protein, partial [Candidatus Vogelbacteria bacterium]
GYTFTANLTVGSTRTADVTALQQILIDGGYLAIATPTGTFGPLTKAAVIKWQIANDITPASGYVGPISRGVLNALAAAVTPPPFEPPVEPLCQNGNLVSNNCQPATPATVPLCPNLKTIASNCTLLPNAVAEPLCPNLMTIASNCMTAPGGTIPPVTGGGAGSIEDADFVSGITGEEVGEGADDVAVLGLDIDADEGSDLNLTAVRLDFTVGTADQDFEDYASEVSVWFEGEEVARVDGDAFTDGNNYDKTLALAGGAIIKAGDTGQLVVKVSGVSNLDTNDVGETWTLEVESVRFEDADGAIITENATGDINGVTRTFSFESFAASADTELKIAEKTGAAADAINKSHMINSHATEITEDVKLLSFTLEAEGTSDLEIREFFADFVVTGATDVDGVIRGNSSPSARLFIDGEEYGTAAYVDADGVTVGADEEIMWDDVNYTLTAGTTVDAYIEVDLNDTTGATAIDDLDQGDTILAQITATQRAALTDIDVRDETGTQLAVTDITGTATGEANQIYDVMFTMTTAGWTNGAVIPGGAATLDDQVNFELVYTITAVDGNVYIDNACVEDADGTLVLADDATDGFSFFQTAGTLANVALTCSHTTTGATLSTDRWLVADGTSETFKVAINAIADVGSSFVQLAWEGMGWSEADEAGDRLFEGSLDDTYKSNSVFIKMN